MAGFKELYDYCQTLTPKIKRNVVKKKALEITGKKTVACIRLALDTTEMRGLFLSVNDKDDPYVKQLGCDIIVLPKLPLNECWERFIFVKELLHLFDSDEQRTSTAEQLGELLSEFDTLPPSGERSPQFESEVDTAWMAIACLCPETFRVKYLDDYNNGRASHYDIALELRIPEQQVRALLRKDYPDIIATILQKR